MTQAEAHEKVIKLIEDDVYFKFELAKLVGISKPTFYKREKSGKWRRKEVNVIKDL